MSYGTREGGARMTFDGMPLRDGEEEKIFEGHSLNWWRQFSVSEHKKNGTEPWGKKGLTDMLMDDFENHFGFGELTADTMNNDGALRLVQAIVGQCVDRIMDAKIIELNGGCELYNGKKVLPQAMEIIRDERQKAIRDLGTQYFQTYLFGMAPDAIVREADRIAKVKVKEFYTAQEKKISEHIRKSGITIKELVAEMRKLNIDDEEIPEWITHCDPLRERTLKKIIKRLKKVKKEEEHGTVQSND